jgi:hypothetical protein
VRERLLDERVIIDDEYLHAASRSERAALRARVPRTLRAVRWRGTCQKRQSALFCNRP